MRVGSLFTGVGGFDLGLERAGFNIAWQCEADAKCRALLKRHWPGVPCFEDVRCVGEQPGRDDLPAPQPSAADQDQRLPLVVDLLCGGFPCQDLSVAGKRAGLEGNRSGLFYEFMRVADELVRPGGFVLIENVPGLLSSQRGRDFAIVLASLADLGFHDLAYRVLDSRYFGVPQRRRRVYVLARRASGGLCAEVLLEPEGSGGDSEASREAGEGSARTFGVGVAGTLGRQSGSGGSRTTDLDSHGAYVAAPLTRGSAATPGVSYPGRRKEDDENLVVARALTAENGQRNNGTEQNFVTHTLRAEGFDASEDGTGRGTPLISTPPNSNGVRAASGIPGRLDGAVTAFHATQEPITEENATPALGSSAYIGHNGRGLDSDRNPIDPKPDGPRYAQMGNAVTVPVAEWIGHRLMATLEHQEAA